MSESARRDETHMLRAVELAERGRGLTSPGAMVGAVLVTGDTVVGEGCYTFDGVIHAEVRAIEQAGAAARGATLYVTLEPCSHQGRTPPCVEAVKAAGVDRVVVGTTDPDPRVNGRGIEALREAGIRVETGVCASAAGRMNEAFVHATRNQRPFGILKVAMTLDGKIATPSGESRWITSAEARGRAQDIRHGADALLTGSGTILGDDPLLTDRSGRERRRPLVRAVIDRRGRIGPSARIFTEPGVVIYTGVPHFEVPAGHEAVVGTTHIRDVITDLARRDVQTVMFECGPDLAFDSIACGFVDKIVAFVAPRIIGGREIPAFGSDGVRTLPEAFQLDEWSVEHVGPDLMISAYVHRNH